MALDNLRAFIGAIETQDDLVRVDRPVAVDKEITEIADRCMKSPGGGPALLFQQPTLLAGGRSRYPVAVNLFGSERRMALALGVECLDEIGERIATLLNLKIPDSLFGKLAMLPQLAEVAKFPPKTAGGRPPCQEVVLRDQDVDLSRFPIPVCWPEDGGPYITLPGSSPGIRGPGSGTWGCTASRAWGATSWGGAGREDARRDRAGGRPRVDLRRVGAAPAHDRRVPVRRLSAQGTRAAREGGELRPGGARRGRGRRGRLHRSGGGAGAGRAVRRAHRVLLARGLLPQGARQRGDDAQRDGLAR